MLNTPLSFLLGHVEVEETKVIEAIRVINLYLCDLKLSHIRFYTRQRDLILTGLSNKTLVKERDSYGI